MFFHKESQQAFVFPPKNGTHTIVHFFHQLGWKRTETNIRERHLTTDVLLQTYPNLVNYTLYGFLRDPVKRFESILLHLKQFPYTRLQLDEFLQEQKATPREQISYDEMVDLFPVMPSWFDIMFKPQADWLAHPKVTVLDFDNYEAEIRRIANNYDLPLVRYNSSIDFGKSVVTQKVIDFVRQHYAADYALAKDRLGKEY